ncbi:hypothetical protein IMSAGC020_02743 [Lachnospiraceae bacterium]|nr:hypothetical protein IMSAGC020_02743 [Lachnospiraceae bacterium]
MVVLVGGGFAGVVMDEGALLGILAVVGDGVHQNGEPAPFPCRYRDSRDAQHLGKAVKVDLHAPFFHDIHHVKSKHDRLAEFYELQSQIQVPLEAGSVNDVDNDVNLVAHDAFS